MSKKSSPKKQSDNLPVSKQTAGGVTGAIVGGVVAGPIGAVLGAVAGTLMGNRAAKGESLVSDGITKKAGEAVEAVKASVPALRPKKKVSKTTSKPVRKPATQPAKPAPTKPRAAAKKTSVTVAVKKSSAKRKPTSKKR